MSAVVTRPQMPREAGAGYRFPPPPRPEAQEWPGTPIALSNCVTRTRGRTPRADKTLDADPAKREQIVRAAERAFASAPPSRRWSHDVVIHGVRVRAHTTSAHHIDFWRDNWFGAEEWRQATGRAAPDEPAVTVYALSEVADEMEGAYYSQELGAVVFFNTSYYGQLKSWVLGAVGRVLAADWGIHSIHGACVQAGEQAVLFIAPTGTGKSTASYGVMTRPDARFHSDDWVYVRYAWPLRGGWWSPLRVRRGEEELARGFRSVDWLRGHRDAGATVTLRSLDDEQIEVPSAELPLDEELRAFAYISEKQFYLRSNIVENYPAALPSILASKLENVPDVDPGFVAERREFLEALCSELRKAGAEAAVGTTQPELSVILARLFAFDNARAMLDPARVFPGRVFSNPLEPVQLTHVVLMERNFSKSVVAERLPLSAWMSRLLIGQTPDGKREVAYNAYRAVDDAAERRYLDSLGEEALQGDMLFSAYEEHSQRPVSLDEEFALMRQLYEAANTYSVNTVMQRMPGIGSKQAAVALALRLLEGMLQRSPAGQVEDSSLESWMPGAISETAR